MVSGRAVAAASCAVAVVLFGVAVGVASPDHPMPPAEVAFDEPVRYRVATAKRAHPPNGIAVADLDGDRVPDFAAGMDGTPNVFVMLGDGKGGYRPGYTVPVRVQAHQIVAGDMDGDGDVDLVVPQHADRIAVLTNDGRARFTVRVRATKQKPPAYGNVTEPDIALADVDRDGRLDVVVGSGVLYVLRWTANGPAAPRRWDSPGTSRKDPWVDLGILAVGDLTGDGAPEIVRSVDRDGVVTIARNDGSGRFAGTYTVDAGVRKPPPLRYEEGGCSGDACYGGGYRGVGVRTAAAIADVDFDGRPDLVVAHSYTDGLTVRRATATGKLGKPRRVAAGLGEVDRLAFTDFNGDGWADFVAALTDHHTVAVLLSRGPFAYHPAVRVPAAPGAAYDVLAADVDGDRDPDVVVGDISRDRIVVIRSGRQN